MEAAAALKTVVGTLVDAGASRGQVSAGISAALRVLCLLPPPTVGGGPTVVPVTTAATSGAGKRQRRRRARERRRERAKVTKATLDGKAGAVEASSGTSPLASAVVQASLMEVDGNGKKVGVKRALSSSASSLPLAPLA